NPSAGWQEARRASARMAAAPRPGDRTPPPEPLRPAAPIDVGLTLTGAVPAPRPVPPSSTPPHAALPHSPTRSAPPTPGPGSEPGLTPAVGEISEVGARPLIDDKLGWDTSVGNRQMPAPTGATRLDSDIADYKIKSNRMWLIIAILLIVAVAGGVAAIIVF